MKTYIVQWEIEIDAESALGAAQEALRIQRDESSLATVFSVKEKSSKKTLEIELDSAGVVVAVLNWGRSF